jgi:AcrR family transcriptional regulator
VSQPDAAPAAGSRRVRRAPGPGERQRDATRSRERILDAALTEFAAKGYAGARVREIARRAGVNTQLISYYFGGKEGLYNELVTSWFQQEARMEQENLSFADTVVWYLRVLAARPELLRIFIWEGLTRGTHQSDGQPDSKPSRGELPELADLRRRQAAGEIADDIDPAYLLVAVMGAITTIVTMPTRIEQLCGVRADSAEFISTFDSQLRRIIGHLAGPGPAPAPAPEPAPEQP